MGISSFFAGNSAVANSVRPAPPLTGRQAAYVRNSGTVATRPAPDPAQQNRAPDRRNVQIPPATPPPAYYPDEEDTSPKKRNPFWLYVVIVVLVAAALYGTKVQVIDPWWQGVQNQIHYGDSKMGYSVLQLTGDTTLNNIITFIRTDSKTGSAYLIVIDVQPGKKPQQLVKSVMGPEATNQAITSATTEDVNGDGKTDVVIHIQNDPVRFAILNDGQGNLSWATP